MNLKPTLAEWIADFTTSEARKNIEHIEIMPATNGVYAPLPSDLHPKLASALLSRGITQLYSHQAEAYHHAMHQQSFTAVTPTASGKSLCYHLPVLQTILTNPSSRALYLFPTKALAQDQKNAVNDLIEAIDAPILSYTYDGDTAPGIRTKVRKAGHIVMTNPDMLHAAILPHHTKWVSLFENLDYIVIDELHTCTTRFF